MNRRTFHRNLLSGLAAAAFPAGLRAALPTASTTLAVDTHAHIFLRSLPPVPSARYVPDYDATADQYLAQLDRHGLTHGVLVQPSFLGTDNRHLVSALRAHPDRLRGVVVVEPAVGPDELRRLDAMGVVGIRLNLIGQPIPDFTQAPWPAFLQELLRLRWFVEVQREARDLPRVIDPLLALGLSVVVDHFGRPDPALGVDDPGFRHLLQAARTRRLWLKLSGAYRNGAAGVGERIAEAAMPLVRAAFGPSQLLWGSDWPHTQFERAADYGAVRAQLDRWLPDPAERRTVLHTAPASLYRI